MSLYLAALAVVTFLGAVGGCLGAARAAALRLRLLLDELAATIDSMARLRSRWRRFRRGAGP